MTTEAKVALVTGASRGLGAVIARRLAGDGWTVAVNYRSDHDGAERVADGIRAAGGRAETFAADVTDEESTRALAEAVAGRLGPVGALVLNATGPQPEVPIEDLTWQDHLDQLTFFVKSPTLLVRAFLPGWKERGGGRVIQIGSDVVDRALPRMSAYIAAKAAQQALTRSWARELGPHGVTVNLVAPGWIPVERHAGLEVDEYLAEVPLGRMGTPGDIAGAVCFLASDAAAFITGERVTVNGGHT
ncbi:SDR family oxidoreductase [Nonomuraea sp. NPDC049725]|uniref:SDR family oxidoreductase n=1 Tax=Nonomuraea sp. NPDC049725 TaxID=3154508 RepID=UPI0034467961